MKKIISIAFFALLILALYFYGGKIEIFLQIDWREWIKLILTTTIGGAIGGLITYLYVIYKENKKEARAVQREIEKNEKEKKEKCTTSLLNIQMTISLQINELKGLEEICLSIINFKIAGKTLATHLHGINGISGKASRLQELVHQQEVSSIRDFLKFAHHLIIPINNMIPLPQEIFNISPIVFDGKKLIVAELANYFKEVATCNRRYMQIIALTAHHNEIRNIIITQPISNAEAGVYTSIGQQEELNKMLGVIAARFELSLTLNKQIESYFEKANKVFIKTGDYIHLLGVTPSIQVARDQKGKMIFDRLSEDYVT